MDIILPEQILQEFVQKARDNVDENGKLVALLCYFFGHIAVDEQNRTAKKVLDGILFPSQTSTSSNVNDNGKRKFSIYSIAPLLIKFNLKV